METGVRITVTLCIIGFIGGIFIGTHYSLWTQVVIAAAIFIPMMIPSLMDRMKMGSFFYWYIAVVFTGGMFAGDINYVFQKYTAIGGLPSIGELFRAK
jgi:hypothetical protein